ncbi:MAG TPA: lipopolysaccharide heptosyltransferase II [Pyrinomonadaceae bacterium]|nr:lipopolysaccharide heptosyltransferase II [Pyrinomonadaceae bacterium]
MTQIKSTSIKRIVVRGTNWVGDAVMTVPALRKLRALFPAAHITLATRSLTEGIFIDPDFLDELQLHAHSGILSTIGQVREWRKGQFDLAVLFPNSFESALVAFLAGVPARIGYGTDGRRMLLTHPLPQPEWRSTRHEVYYYLEIIDQLAKITGVSSPDDSATHPPDGSLRVSEVRRKAALDLLDVRAGNPGGKNTPTRPLIALCPGSINSRAKRWPMERYAALADRLINELGAEVLLIGSNDELEVSREVAQLMRGKAVVLTGETDLADAIAILSLVDLLVTNDTGPAHIASALGRPTLVIFGPTNPLTTRPFSEVGEIVRHPPDCAPCMLRDCPIDHRCMTAISPEEVFERAMAILETSAMSGKRQEVQSSTFRMPGYERSKLKLVL